MSHKQQREFVERVRSNFSFYFGGKNVLEVGSLIINGSIRDFFIQCNYTGIDVGEGWGVDVVCQGQDYSAPDNTFDVVCSGECFEHNPYWLETFKNMIRLTKSGGLIFFTCATTGREEHGTIKNLPEDSKLTIELGWDYYKNLNEQDFKEHINFVDEFSYFGFETNDEAHDLYFWGIKK